MTLGEIIKEYRKTNKYSQDYIAAKSGLSKAYISILERNMNPKTGLAPVPSLKTIKAVAAALNCSFDAIFAKLDNDLRVSVGAPGEVTPQDIFDSFVHNDYDYEADPEGRLSRIPADAFNALFEKFEGDKRYVWAAYNARRCNVDEATIELNALALAGVKRKEFEEAYEKYRKLPLPAPRIAEDVVTLPIVTSVAAHYDAMSFYEGGVEGETVDIPLKYLRGRPVSDYCVMRVKGDSMYPDFRDGDLVLVLLQSTLNRPRDIGVIAYGDEEMTIKRIDYVMGEDWLELIPINTSLPPKRIEGADLELCRVIGIPKLLIREL